MRFVLFFFIAFTLNSIAFAQSPSGSPRTITDSDLKKWFDICPEAKQLVMRTGTDVNSVPSRFDAGAYKALQIKFNNSPERKIISGLEAKWWQFDILLQSLQSNINSRSLDKTSLNKFINQEIATGTVDDRNNLLALQSRLWQKPVKGPIKNIDNEQIISYLKNKKAALQNQIVPLKEAFAASSNANGSSRQLRALETGAPKGIGMSMQYIEASGNPSIKNTMTYAGRNPLTLFSDSQGKVIGYQIVTGSTNGQTHFVDVTLKNQCQPSAIHMNTIGSSGFKRNAFAPTDCSDATQGNSIPTRWTGCRLVFGLAVQGVPEGDSASETER